MKQAAGASHRDSVRSRTTRRNMDRARRDARACLSARLTIPVHVVPHCQDNDKSKKKAADAAINDVLFKEAVSKKDLAKRALEKAAAKMAKAKEKEPEKRDIYSDSRDAGPSKDDDMSTWDDEKLAAVVNKKKGGQGERCQTDIICKHFLDAVEKRTYGWFWECPNGGDKCQYRHALPEGYVLKRDRVDEEFDKGPSLEDQIEEQRKGLKSRTPVTFERLQEWLARKKAAKAAEEEEALDAARKQYAKGKISGVSGRMLFSIDASLFVDDAAAGADQYVREDSDDEDGEGGAGSAGAPLAAPSGGGYLGGEDDDASDPVEQQQQQGGTEASTAAGDGKGATTYSANYGADAEAVVAAPVDVSDLQGVDESLFLDEDLPDDDELE